METGRNDPCRCGSGKAYVQCCGRSASAGAGSDESSIAKAIQAGLGHHQAGRLSQAEALYRQVLQAEPAHPDALHYLGVIAYQMGDGERAAELIGRAISGQPSNPHYHSNLGLALQKRGTLSDAIACYRKALSLRPDFAEAHYNLGNALLQQGQVEEAVASYRRALSLAPDYAEAHNNLGVALLRRGRSEEAIASHRRALSFRPDHAEAHNNLGMALSVQGKLEDAALSYRHALSFRPDFAEAHYNLGNALLRQRKLDAAIAGYRQALSFRPDFAEARNNLGNAFKEQGKLDEAIASYRQALSFRPDFAEAHNNLGNALKEQDKLDEALVAYRQALSLQSDFAEAHNNIGNVLREQGELEPAVASYRHALSLMPEAATIHSNLVYALNFDPAYPPDEVFRAHLEWARAHAEALPRLTSRHANERSVDRVLRIGYVSPNFRNHAVAYFFEPVLACHDATRCEIFCYSDVVREDACTARLKSYGAQWRECTHLTDAELAETILRDKIDVLIDLSGHIERSRLLVFARKPAPVQVTWNGYANTTGMTAMDFRITDALADPPGMTEHLHTEQLLRMPNTYMVFRPPEDGPAVNDLPASKHGNVTFGSFNALSKITPQVVQVWSRILAAVPGARLVIARVAGGRAGHRILDLFACSGIESSRLELCAKLPSREFLALHHKADIALDPFPFSGTTTTCDSLWMGLPVVTLAGQSHVSRVGASMLTNVGLPSMVANSFEEYVTIATGVAADLGRLSALRRGLRHRMLNSPLTDARRFTRHLEDHLRQIWAGWCRRQA